MPSRASWTFSGSDAAATIRVWKAWLTGSEIAVKPASWNTLTAACTAGVSPPMTAWLLLLTLAMTTYPSEAPTIRSISGIAPDMVMGHSLGEYGALVAAGVLNFEHALEAVSARSVVSTAG